MTSFLLHEIVSELERCFAGQSYATGSARRAMKMAARICVCTNDNLVVESITL